MAELLLAEVGFAPALGGFFLLLVILGLLASLFWLWMLIDALLHEPSGTEKIIWVLVIFFLHFLGALLYFFIRKSHRTPASTL
jgi:hypothetical protein